jgi:hypothetical protein
MEILFVSLALGNVDHISIIHWRVLALGPYTQLWIILHNLYACPYLYIAI